MSQTMRFGRRETTPKQNFKELQENDIKYNKSRISIITNIVRVCSLVYSALFIAAIYLLRRYRKVIAIYITFIPLAITAAAMFVFSHRALTALNKPGLENLGKAKQMLASLNNLNLLLMGAIILLVFIYGVNEYQTGHSRNDEHFIVDFLTYMAMATPVFIPLPAFSTIYNCTVKKCLIDLEAIRVAGKGWQSLNESLLTGGDQKGGLRSVAREFSHQRSKIMSGSNDSNFNFH